ncbi:MAG TPA: hypothetical protein VJT13_25980 [Xanthobacteraceae bacterium]|nr:hypothetical protein [Xanthobacteraceae bacterium]
MTTATLRISTPIPATRKAPRKSLLARMYDAFIEARMRAALREIAMRRHLVPEDVLKKAGYTATASNDSAYPFTR